MHNKYKTSILLKTEIFLYNSIKLQGIRFKTKIKRKKWLGLRTFGNKKFFLKLFNSFGKVFIVIFYLLISLVTELFFTISRFNG